MFSIIHVHQKSGAHDLRIVTMLVKSGLRHLAFALPRMHRKQKPGENVPERFKPILSCPMSNVVRPVRVSQMQMSQSHSVSCRIVERKSETHAANIKPAADSDGVTT
jgi:hypothetical protein